VLNTGDTIFVTPLFSHNAVASACSMDWTASIVTNCDSCGTRKIQFVVTNVCAAALTNLGTATKNV